MPSRNRLKIYADDSFYHVYNRGVEKRKIFIDEQDYAVFLNLFKRYLSKKPTKDDSGREYSHMNGRIELLAFCLMPNHYHLLIYIHDKNALTELMLAVISSYSTYFNKKYTRVGPLFQDRYKASHILNEGYLQHISRYIHLNPRQWRQWEFSSLPYYLGERQAEWLLPNRIAEMMEDTDYLEFLNDYEEHKSMLDEIKYDLADY
ncbi:transposase [Candidatus Parcubacteria bacterium]|nr:transposase [Candidatus Parcubacteria bacterium]